MNARIKSLLRLGNAARNYQASPDVDEVNMDKHENCCAGEAFPCRACGSSRVPAETSSKYVAKDEDDIGMKSRAKNERVTSSNILIGPSMRREELVEAVADRLIDVGGPLSRPLTKSQTDSIETSSDTFSERKFRKRNRAWRLFGFRNKAAKKRDTSFYSCANQGDGNLGVIQDQEAVITSSTESFVNVCILDRHSQVPIDPSHCLSWTGYRPKDLHGNKTTKMGLPPTDGKANQDSLQDFQSPAHISGTRNPSQTRSRDFPIYSQFTYDERNNMSPSQIPLLNSIDALVKSASYNEYSDFDSYTTSDTDFERSQQSYYTRLHEKWPERKYSFVYACPTTRSMSSIETTSSTPASLVERQLITDDSVYWTVKLKSTFQPLSEDSAERWIEEESAQSDLNRRPFNASNTQDRRFTMEEHGSAEQSSMWDSHFSVPESLMDSTFVDEIASKLSLDDSWAGDSVFKAKDNHLTAANAQASAEMLGTFPGTIELYQANSAGVSGRCSPIVETSSATPVSLRGGGISNLCPFSSVRKVIESSKEDDSILDKRVGRLNFWIVGGRGKPPTWRQLLKKAEQRVQKGKEKETTNKFKVAKSAEKVDHFSGKS